MINGTEYAWEDIQVHIKGNATPLEGITDIKYKSSRNVAPIYGRGSDPIAYGRGQRGYEGSMVILQSTLESLIRASADSDPKNAVMEITVSYAPEGGVATTDVLKYAMITEFEKGMASGDTHAEISLPLFIGKINYNV